MRIDIWYHSDDPEIIVWDKDNSSKTASQKTPSVNHVTHSGRVYQPPKKEKDVSKGKELSSDTTPAKEEDDLVLKQLKKPRHKPASGIFSCPPKSTKTL